MKKRFFRFLLILAALGLPLLAIDVWFSAAPGTVDNGVSYYVEATAFSDVWWEGNDLWLFKNGSYVSGGYGSGYFSTGTWQSDGGPQTIEYYAEAWEWAYGQSAGAWNYVTINPPPNQPPWGVRDYHHGSVPQNSNLHASGWAVDNEKGAPVTRVDILIDGNDVGDANLGGYRPDVADAYGRSDFTYSGWSFDIGIGGLGVGTHSLELRAWDNQGASATFGYATFTVTNGSPNITLLSPGTQTINLNTALTITSNATDPSGDITTHNLDIQRPDGTWNWQGGFAAGEPYLGGPVGSGGNSTRSASFTFNIPGTWYVRSWVNDSANQSLHSATVAITVINPNSAPTIAWTTPPPAYPNSGTNFTARATGTDPDGNLSNVQVDISTNGGAWGAFAYNGGGNGSTNTSDANLQLAGAEGTTYQFRAKAFDSGGLSSSYIYTTVSTVNRTPGVTLQILDSGLNPLPIGGNGRAQIFINSTYYVRVSGTDPDGRLAILQERHIPIGGSQVNNQVSVSGASAANNFGPFSTGATAGMIDTWAHVQDADAGAFVTTGQGWAYVGGPDIDVNKLNQASLTITSLGSTIYGDTYTGTANGGNGSGALEWALGTGSTATGAAINPTSGVIAANSIGTVVIKVRRLGDATYNDSAWSADHTVTVNARPITVTLGGSKVYDSSTASTGASATITSGNLVLGDTIAYAYAATPSPLVGSYAGLATPTISNATTPATRTGSYAITYAGTYAIIPRAITVTLSGTKVYDSTTSSTGASATITSGTLAGSDTIACAFAATASPIAGAYTGLTTATISNASAPTARSGSYAITYTGTYSITPRPITVTLSGTKTYDSVTTSTGASATVTSGTLAGSDTIAYVFAATSSPIAGAYTGLTTATISNPAAPTARSGSYTITYAGSYSITPRAITVTLAGSKIYDSTTTSTGASATVTSGTLAGSDTIGYVFAAISSPVAGSYSGLTTATITNSTAPTARSGSYNITYAGSYTVTPRSITVTLTGSKVYDGTTASTGAGASITTGNLAGTDTIGYAFAASPSVMAGTYPGLATATIANTVAPTSRTASYTITYLGNYTISPRPITVTLTGSKAYNGNTTATGASASITSGTLAAPDTIGFGFAATGSANAGTYTGLTTATISNTVAPTNRTASYAITHNGSYAITQAVQPGLTLNAVTTQSFNATQSLTTTGGAGTGAVTFAIVGQSGAGVAALTSNNLTANTGTGWVDLQATKASDTNYLAATSSTVRVNFARINQATLSMTATPASILYGDTSALTTSGGSGTGAVSYVSAAGGIITGSTFTATASTGTVLVTATKAADANYNASSGTANITLAKRGITVTLAGSKTANGNTTATGASASVTTGTLANGDTVTYAFAATSSANAGFYTGLTTATVKNAATVDMSAHYIITYTGTYTVWPAPTVASGLRAWYRADFGLTKDGLGSVSQWTDASGRGFNLTQTDPAKQPLWGGNVLNGQPAIDFADGERMKSAVIDLLDAAGSSHDLTVVVVFQPAATQLAGASMLDHDAQTQQGFALKQDGSITNKYLLRWRNQALNAWQGEGGPTVSTVVQPHLLTFIKGGTTQTLYVNGEMGGSATVQANMNKPLAAFALGGSASVAGDYFGGRIAEVIVYNRALTPTERGQVETGLGTRYGLANVGGEPDSLGDAWEMQHFGHLGYGPNEDPDNDGLTNLQEYLLGRNPLKGQQPDSTGAVNLRVFSPRP